MNRIQEYIVNYRKYKEDRNRVGAKEELTLLSQSLEVNKSLARAIADYETGYSGGWIIGVSYKGKKYWEKMNSCEEKFQALEVIFNKIKEAKNGN